MGKNKSMKRGSSSSKGSAKQSTQAISSFFPLLITIGPQCAGKTTFISTLSESFAAYDKSNSKGDDDDEGKLDSIIDVVIDNIPQVYEKLDKDLVCNWYADNKMESSVLDRMTYGNSIRRRLDALKASEQVLLLLYMQDKISDSELETFLGCIEGNKNTLLTTIRNAKMNGKKFTSLTIDLFIPQALPSAIQTSLNTLKDSLKNETGSVVSWGNTNLLSKDYADALSYAATSKRPVRFIRYGKELPSLSLQELIARSVDRFLLTGRYIPTDSIDASLKRCMKLYADIGDVQDNSHENLARLAGYTMDSNGFVSKNTGAPAIAATDSLNPTIFAKWNNSTLIVADISKAIETPAVSVASLVVAPEVVAAPVAPVAPVVAPVAPVVAPVAPATTLIDSTAKMNIGSEFDSKKEAAISSAAATVSPAVKNGSTVVAAADIPAKVEDANKASPSTPEKVNPASSITAAIAAASPPASPVPVGDTQRVSLIKSQKKSSNPFSCIFGLFSSSKE